MENFYSMENLVTQLYSMENCESGLNSMENLVCSTLLNGELLLLLNGELRQNRPTAPLVQVLSIPPLDAATVHFSCSLLHCDNRALLHSQPFTTTGAL